MKVFLVLDGWNYYVTVGVFSTEELAQKFIDSGESDAYDIVEEIVDDPEVQIW